MNHIEQSLKLKGFRLSQFVWQKRYFDPLSKEDIAEYKYFLDNNRWKNHCPFMLEWPYLTITDMIRTRLIDAHINRMMEVE